VAVRVLEASAEHRAVLEGRLPRLAAVADGLAHQLVDLCRLSAVRQVRTSLVAKESAMSEVMKSRKRCSTRSIAKMF